MTEGKSELSDLTKAMAFARQALYDAFDVFARGESQSVSGTEDAREARAALDLLTYLRDLGQLLMPLTRVVSDLEETSHRWLGDAVTRISGEEARRKVAKALKAVDRLEDKLRAHLAKGPPFPPSGYGPT